MRALRPKDMQPSTFNGKGEEWMKWSEEVEDYAEAVHPGRKAALEWALKRKVEITEEEMQRGPIGLAHEERELRHAVYTLRRGKRRQPRSRRRSLNVSP